MSIMVVSTAFYPDNYHINQMVQGLVTFGHIVKVLTGQPDYATEYVPKEHKGFRKYHDFLSKVEVLRVPIIAIRKEIIRYFNCLSFIISGSILALFKKWTAFDVVYMGSVLQITMVIPAIFIKKHYKKPLLFYFLDLWPKSMNDFKIGEKNPIFQTVRILCKWIYKQISRYYNDKIDLYNPYIKYTPFVGGK